MVGARLSRRIVARWLTRALTALLLLLAAYLFAGLVGGALVSNPDWRPPARGVTIWVESNGVHTGLVVPVVAAGVDWRATFAARDLADPRYGGYDHLAIGWGERAFYLETPRWADVKPLTVLRALTGGGDTLLHVEHIPAPAAAPDERPVTLRPEEYQRLAAVIRATLAPGGRAMRGYDRYDAFYPARGRYSALRTCNVWTGDALRAAGVRVGRWTPFPVTVTRWF